MGDDVEFGRRLSTARGSVTSVHQPPVRTPCLWLQTGELRPSARARLLVLPPAGAGPRVYQPWRRLVPEWLELWSVCPPGREARIGERPVETVDEYVEGVANALTELPPLPIAVFGHSMGAYVAWQLAHRIEETEGASLLQLFTSGHRAPSAPPDRPPAHLESLEGLYRLVNQLWGGFPPVVEDDAETLQHVLRLLRADLRALETHPLPERAPINAPIAVLTGSEDVSVSIRGLEGWRNESRSEVVFRSYPGGHQYLETAWPDVARFVVARVRGRLRAG